MRRFLPRSFFGQLVLGTLVVQTLLLGLFIWYTVVSQTRLAQQRTGERIVGQLNRLSVACATELEQSDLRGLQNVLELSRISPTIEVARLTDLSGKTLAVSSNGRSSDLDPYERAVLADATRQQSFKIKNGQMEAVTPVLQAGRPVALLWLEPNHSLATGTVSTVVRIALSYGGFALLANIVPIFLIVRTITQPLSKLRAATDRFVQDAELGGELPLPVTTTNEAGELTTSFNAMVGELGAQRRGLLETLALLDSMLSNAPIGFAFFDRELRYVRVNEFLAGLHDLPVELHLGKMPSAVYPASIGEAKLECLRQVFETGVALRDIEFAGEMPHAPGLQRHWLMHFYPVRTQQGTLLWVGVIVVEITERIQAEEALRKTEKLAATGRLAASIAHEINNPLEAVTNILYLLGTHESLDETALELTSMAQSELARVAHITQQTLRFYRQSTLPSRIALNEVLDSILALYQARMVAGNVVVHRSYCADTEMFGFGGELRQVFANLVGNALDAMPKGGSLMVRIKRGHGRHPDGSWLPGVRVSVTDTGSGMSEATARRIFEAFFTTKQATGTGLGLWISEEIVRKHSGSVRVRSRQGQRSGTSFMMFFPATEVGGGVERTSEEPDSVSM